MKFRGSCSGPNKQCQKCKMHGGYVCCGEPISVLHYLTCNENQYTILVMDMYCDDCYCLFTTEHLINSTFEQKLNICWEKNKYTIIVHLMNNYYKYLKYKNKISTSKKYNQYGGIANIENWSQLTDLNQSMKFHIVVINH